MPSVSSNLKAKIRTSVGPALVAAAAFWLTVGVGAQSQPPAEKTAVQAFKNIQVLKDVPASQLIPGMRYITTALGVECNYCHVEGNFASDDKQSKETARHMMTMLFSINKNNFDGRPQVGCYTCHQGHSEPIPLPALPAEATEPQFSRLAADAPTLTAVLNKFAEAQGGQDALNKINTRVLQLQQSRDGKTSTIQTYQKAPGKLYSIITAAQGRMTAGFDGRHGWFATDEGTQDLSGPEKVIFSREAQINPSAAIAGYKPKRLFGEAKIGDTTAYVVFSTAPDGNTELLFFDEQSGLLIRRMIRYRTVFGALPVEADYSDYREVDGVKIPYKTVWFTNGQTSAYTVTGVQDNVPVDDSKFEPPKKSQ